MFVRKKLMAIRKVNKNIYLERKQIKTFRHHDLKITSFPMRVWYK